MAKVRVKLRPSSISGRKGSIYYQVSHRSVVRIVTTSIRLLPTEWDQAACRVVMKNACAVYIQNRIDSDLDVLQSIITRLETAYQLADIPFTADDIVSMFREPTRFMSVISFIRLQVCELTECGRLGTATNYSRMADSLHSFLNGRDLVFSEITSVLVEQYGNYLRRRCMCRNSISFFMRIFRAIYNKAVNQGIVEQTNPFRTVYTGVDRTRKRAVEQDIIMRLTQLNLPDKAYQTLAKDMFLFSFYTRGMAFVDMAFLRKTDVMDGVIRYSRHKTGQQMTVRIEPCMQEIIDKYACRADSTPYVFPIIRGRDAASRYHEYIRGLRNHNNQLAKIARLLGLSHSLSSYSSRHSWATIARNHNIPLSVISAGMGHASMRTTQIYLSNIEDSVVDKANSSLLRSLNIQAE